MTPACALLNTSVGRCGIAWGPQGVRAFQLPEHDDAATLRRMARRAGAGRIEGARSASRPGSSKVWRRIAG